VAYALIAWSWPHDDHRAVHADLTEALSLRGGTTTPTEFFPGLFLYPSPSTGIGFDTVRRKVASVVADNPGLQVMVIMPSKGETVAGWIDPLKGTFDEVRPTLNQDDVATMPILFPSPVPGLVVEEDQ